MDTKLGTKIYIPQRLANETTIRMNQNHTETVFLKNSLLSAIGFRNFYQPPGLLKSIDILFLLS